MLIAQLSDLHLCATGPLAVKNVYAERAVDALLRLDPRPDVVLLTGDLTEYGTREEYGLLRTLIGRLPMPAYAIPGNHDERAALRAAVAEAGYLNPGSLHYAVETRPVRLIGLDSIIPGRVEGALDEDALGFLDESLSAHPDVPALVFLHHPPFRSGLPGKDSIRLLAGADGLALVLARHPQVERVVAGHHHRALQARFGGTLCQVAPPVRYMTPEECGIPATHEIDHEPAGFLLHHWIEGQGLATRVCPLLV
ncbi:MAG TPA: metallophosphoesterase [Microvirga sp.]|jgi:3',5'-cyclic AMP phosphodiesterase CpdA